MQPRVAQPNAATLSEDVVRTLVAALAPEASAGPLRTTTTDVHSNDLATAYLADGRTLVIKRGRFDWCAPRFDASRRASALLRGAGIAAPAPLDLPRTSGGRAIEAYWRIDLPIMDEIWPSLDERSRDGLLRSLGELARRMHRVSPAAFGSLDGAKGAQAVAELIEADLDARLRPAVHGQWREGAPVVDRLLEMISELASRTAGRRPALIHNDLHMGNILCEEDEGTMRCVGLLDLESATAGLPESDFAMMQLLHEPLFQRSISGAWFAEVRRGYGGELDAWVLRFFRVVHLCNLGYYSALIGNHWHAAEVGRQAAREVRLLDRAAEPAVCLGA